MSTDENNINNIEEIKLGYTKIDKNWLSLHYIITLFTVILAFIVECIMGFILIDTDLVTTTAQTYIMKYIIIPSSANLIFLAVDYIVLRSNRLKFEHKVYVISIVYAIIGFILFTAHSALESTYYIFSGAIILTTVYANSRLTFVTEILSMILMVVSELFLKWDSDKASIFESTIRFANFLTALFIMFALSVVCMIVIRYEKRKNTVSIQIEKESMSLQKSLKLDELTGIFNRKALHDALNDLETYNKNGRYIFTIIDLDRFKTINDNMGHQIGDMVLIEFGSLLRENSGKAVPFRYGGDEFCMLFYDADIDEAIGTCERIQLKLKSLEMENPGLKLTASFGLAKYYDGISSAQLFINADQALYKAKDVRNMIYVFDETQDSI